ncbi:MBL fold metallo-hydrolase [Cupriavidus sp. 30B13]|uniref:MBL fold metallo-hydrolase n=1 Tax=Cupriavidus sp. 30B13 TaxID=3384241 RepID=UPI003B8F3C49
MITNALSGTNVHEVSDGIYRINTPVILEGGPGGFSFNQYLVLDDEPLLFHTGPRKMFELVREAVASVMPPERLRHVAFSHVEGDECGSLGEWLAAAPHAAPLCGTIAAMVSVSDATDRHVLALEDGQVRSLGSHSVRWLATPHLPHGWDCGVLMEEATGTLLCSDLFTQPGARLPALTEGDILGPSEAFRRSMDYYAHAPGTGAMLERLATLAPRTLACMHGSAWRGDGAALLRALAASLRG